ncbi:M16 family metallopeptidase [Azohydromonas caseinilytica]|uniref:M16 family metallopeptidase n=1 Tax=Azohydromonas caseinilytica TaxID=2728836 RepID=UPI00287369F6|nr:pitrilysin family protein [Azohydromonas caseinilytica]
MIKPEISPSQPAAVPVVTELDNGVRVVTVPMPHLRSASVAVFVRTGSRNESARLNGISHFLEHMAFKGTATRDVQAINLDAERIGADMNAYTSKDTTVYYLNGLGRDAPRMLEMLADVVLESTFPEAEIEREREVLLQELVEYEEDPQSVVSQLLDVAAYGKQPLARPIIGTRRHIERITREDLVGYVKRHYAGANLVIAAGGDVQPARIDALARQLFGHVPRGEGSAAEAVAHVGGLQSRRRAGISQVYSSIGLPLPSMRQGHHAGLVAATLFGGGMSAPLVDEVRERRGLAYHVASEAEVSDVHGLLVIDAITQPQKLLEYVATVGRLLKEQAEGIDAQHLERARNQLLVQAVHKQERPFSAIEAAAEQLFVHGRLIGADEAVRQIEAVTAEQVRAVFEAMLQATPAVGLASRGAVGEVLQALQAAMA